VSRALRDTYDVNKETREKVVALAAELKYKPNFNAIGLAKRSTHNIGVILPYITNDYFSKVITGIQEIANSKEFNVTLFLTNDSAERELGIMQNLPISSLDGLLVSVTSNSSSYDHFRELMSNDFPIVFFDRVPAEFKTSKVMQDDYHGAFEAVKHLIENGYRRIAHISAAKELTITQKRLQGYLDALQKHNLPVRDEWIIYSGFSQESGEADTYELLKCKIKPDAIFALNDRKAVGAMVALKNKKITIGKQMGVIGFADDPVASVVTPTLTTISVPALDIGKLSCELLFKHIKKKNFSPQESILPCELIVRESTIKK
jgi:LacI family transcriptional regulator